MKMFVDVISSSSAMPTPWITLRRRLPAYKRRYLIGLGEAGWLTLFRLTLVLSFLLVLFVPADVLLSNAPSLSGSCRM